MINSVLLLFYSIALLLYFQSNIVCSEYHGHDLNLSIEIEDNEAVFSELYRNLTDIIAENATALIRRVSKNNLSIDDQDLSNKPVIVIDPSSASKIPFLPDSIEKVLSWKCLDSKSVVTDCDDTLWSSCSVTDCGVGQNTRNVVCVVAPSTIVNASQCAALITTVAPASTRQCTTTKTCTYSYKCSSELLPTLFGECDSDYGFSSCVGQLSGRSTRIVSCVNSLGISVDFYHCSNPYVTAIAPLSYKQCVVAPCLYAWKCVNPKDGVLANCSDKTWGQCVTNPCQTPYKTRKVVCIEGGVVRPNLACIEAGLTPLATEARCDPFGPFRSVFNTNYTDSDPNNTTAPIADTTHDCSTRLCNPTVDVTVDVADLDTTATDTTDAVTTYLIDDTANSTDSSNSSTITDDSGVDPTDPTDSARPPKPGGGGSGTCDYVWKCSTAGSTEKPSSLLADCAGGVGFSACNACGEGKITRKVVCENTSINAIVIDTMCNEDTRPVSSQYCTSKSQCTYSWYCYNPTLSPFQATNCDVDSSWGTCSTACGKGLQSRVSVCMNQLGEIVDETKCLGTRPSSMRECTGSKCTGYQWLCSNQQQLNPTRCDDDTYWTYCSSSCGYGQKTRAVACFSNSYSVVSNSKCDALVKPADVTPCIAKSTCSWSASAWPSCYCVPDMEDKVVSRTVQCITANQTQVDDSLCLLEKPLSSFVCNKKQCTNIGTNSDYSWVIGEWSLCRGHCGQGYKTRDVNCVNILTGNIVSELFCPENEPCGVSSCSSDTACQKGTCISTPDTVNNVAVASGTCKCSSGYTGDTCSVKHVIANLSVFPSILLPSFPAWVKWSTDSVDEYVTISLTSENRPPVFLGRFRAAAMTAQITIPSNIPEFPCMLRVALSKSVFVEMAAKVGDPCLLAQCNNKGVCDSQRPTCQCPFEWEGEHCEKSRCLRCNTYGTKSCDTDTAVCVCKDGFSGTHCNTEDICANCTCNNGRGFSSKLQGLCDICICNNLSTGDQCQTCNICLNGTPNASCSSCQCEPGYAGSSCHCRGVSVKVGLQVHNTWDKQAVGDLFSEDMSVFFNVSKSRVIVDTVTQNATRSIVSFTLTPDCFVNTPVILPFSLSDPMYDVHTLVGELTTALVDPSSSLYDGMITVYLDRNGGVVVNDPLCSDDWCAKSLNSTSREEIIPPHVLVPSTDNTRLIVGIVVGLTMGLSILGAVFYTVFCRKKVVKIVPNLVVHQRPNDGSRELKSTIQSQPTKGYVSSPPVTVDYSLSLYDVSISHGSNIFTINKPHASQSTALPSVQETAQADDSHEFVCHIEVNNCNSTDSC